MKSPDLADSNTQDPLGIFFSYSHKDEELLKKIAEMTDGQYFRATDNSKLEAIYEEIDQLEKTKVEISSIRRLSEEFLNWALFAGLLLVSEIFLRYSILRSVT